jgi:preprotein translocase subunit YajC
VIHEAFTTIVLAAAEGAPAGDAPAATPSSYSFLIPMALILMVFFWLTSRSQKKRDRQRQQVLDSIKPKDKVVTIGGIHGRVVRAKDDAYVLRVDEEKDICITVQKSAVSRKADDEDEQKEEKKL